MTELLLKGERLELRAGEVIGIESVSVVFFHVVGRVVLVREAPDALLVGDLVAVPEGQIRVAPGRRHGVFVLSLLPWVGLKS